MASSLGHLVIRSKGKRAFFGWNIWNLERFNRFPFKNCLLTLAPLTPSHAKKGQKGLLYTNTNVSLTFCSVTLRASLHHISSLRVSAWDLYNSASDFSLRVHTSDWVGTLDIRTKYPSATILRGPEGKRERGWDWNFPWCSLSNWAAIDRLGVNTLGSNNSIS